MYVISYTPHRVRVSQDEHGSRRLVGSKQQMMSFQKEEVTLGDFGECLYIGIWSHRNG